MGALLALALGVPTSSAAQAQPIGLVQPVGVLVAPEQPWAALKLTQDLPCAYSTAGKKDTSSVVVCTVEGFTVLTDELSRANQRADLAEIKEADVASRLVLVTDDLQACVTAAVCPSPPAPVRLDPTWPLVGYGAGIAGTAGLAAALALDLPTSARVASGGLSLVSLALGIWLVLPDQS